MAIPFMDMISRKLPKPVDHRLEVCLIAQLFYAARHRTDPRAEALIEQALGHFPYLNDSNMQCQFYNTVAFHYRVHNDLSLAAEFYEKALHLSVSTGQTDQQGLHSRTPDYPTRGSCQSSDKFLQSIHGVMHEFGQNWTSGGWGRCESSDKAAAAERSLWEFGHHGGRRRHKMATSAESEQCYTFRGGHSVPPTPQNRAARRVNGKKPFLSSYHIYGPIRGIKRFTHLPSTSFLTQIPDAMGSNIKVSAANIEIGQAAYNIFRALHDEKEKIVTAVATLNTVRRKRGQTASILDLEDAEDSDREEEAGD
ncbi:hypothetical protein GGX14DRAFT_546295 [Mycena pura]|uniref:Uncharacterized protein n=1 Tax=Mycena pura TaxID=153505 RepID=A0AAD6US69_9AGAR|nr:hypothetical protein GGX14DRAFT_546295 [Mycena pura]